MLHPLEYGACAITEVTTELIESRGEIIPLLPAWMNKHSVSALISPLFMQANNDRQPRMGALFPPARRTFEDRHVDEGADLGRWVDTAGRARRGGGALWRVLVVAATPAVPEGRARRGGYCYHQREEQQHMQ